MLTVSRHRPNWYEHCLFFRSHFNLIAFYVNAVIHWVAGALINITERLQRIEYVVLLSIDFSKAFDRVKHQTLVKKMELLDLADHVFNWLVDYFDNRGHATRLGDVISLVAGINALIIQGSVVGPPSYIIVASDLHPKHQRNLMTKYVDDSAKTAKECGNIHSSARNNLHINSNNTKELISLSFGDAPNRLLTLRYSSDPWGWAHGGPQGLGAVISCRLTMGNTSTN